MQYTPTQPAELSEQQRARLRQGCEQISPSWPLENWIAVNPWWKMHGQTLPDVSAKLKVLGGAECLMPRSYFLQRWQSQITPAHLAQAIQESGLATTQQEALEHLQVEHKSQGFMAFSRLLDLRRHAQRQISWHDEIIHQISQSLASYALRLEQGENAEQSLYEYWWEQVIHDHGIAIVMGAPGLSKVFAKLPKQPEQILAMTLQDLEVAAGYQQDFAHAMLLDINGWASWAAHQSWLKPKEAGNNDPMWQLLAIRMAWEWVLYQYICQQEAERYRELIQRWHHQFVVLPLLIDHDKHAHALDWLWQRAAEISYQQGLFTTLREQNAAKPPQQAEHNTALMQAIFCIDVRSEEYRSALESQHPLIETRGFAGFFGLPLAFSPTGHYERPQLPGLLSPSLQLKQSAPVSPTKRNLALSWEAFAGSSLSTFNAVEACGWFYGLKLIKNTWFAAKPKHAVNHSLNHASWQLCKAGQPISTEEQVEICNSVLVAMGLNTNFAPNVLLVGHGSQSCNNHMQAALDCGACCGQTGEVNVRILADMLNDQAVRLGIRDKGIDIPDATQFVAALHNTTTDELNILSVLRALPHEQQQWLTQASAIARQERAGRLAIDRNIQKGIFQRSYDWAQLRPEWGLANNASFIVAQRQHTRLCNLHGRSFLHDYDWQNDEGFRTLELILTAPMVVAHWINFQYYASVTDNHLYGSGDKTLHNVVAGHVGVFEGNGGDLRIGLPMQSLHNGKQWMHEPLRLSVLIHAPQQAIQDIVERHPVVRDLIYNQWLYLYAWQPHSGEIKRLLQGEWQHA